eukprot:4685264-Pleurochrysis_carterae.AAC.1
MSISISACFSLPACDCRCRNKCSASCDALICSIAAVLFAMKSAVSNTLQCGHDGAFAAANSSSAGNSESSVA